MSKAEQSEREREREGQVRVRHLWMALSLGLIRIIRTFNRKHVMAQNGRLRLRRLGQQRICQVNFKVILLKSLHAHTHTHVHALQPHMGHLI